MFKYVTHFCLTLFYISVLHLELQETAEIMEKKLGSPTRNLTKKKETSFLKPSNNVKEHQKFSSSYAHFRQTKGIKYNAPSTHFSIFR